MARNAENIDFHPITKSSVTYLKSEGHPGVFYKIDENQIVHELNFVEAAKMREEALDHVLLHGPPGLGKTFTVQKHLQESDVRFVKEVVCV